MLYKDMLKICKKMTPAQLRTEVCGFEDNGSVACNNLVFWASKIEFDESENRPYLLGTSDVGHECADDCSACQPAPKATLVNGKWHYEEDL